MCLPGVRTVAWSTGFLAVCICHRNRSVDCLPGDCSLKKAELPVIKKKKPNPYDRSRRGVIYILQLISRAVAVNNASLVKHCFKKKKLTEIERSIACFIEILKLKRPCALFFISTQLSCDSGAPVAWLRAILCCRSLFAIRFS